MVRDANGNRKRLTFLGLNGEPVANDFGIASYQWKMESEGQVIESRYDLEGHLVRNRPEFQFMVTRFGFDDQGMLKRMTNLGLDGEHITLDDAGAAHIEVQYDVQGRLVEWANYDDKGQLVIGMTGIAKILYEPSRYGMEQKASFFDQNHNPLSTRWGVHSVVYQFDAFGNVVDRRFLGVSNEPVNTKNGLGIEKTTYSSDGRYVHTTAYLDASENPIGFGPNQIHGTTVKIDHQGRPVKTYFRNLEGQIADGWYGYAIENRVFDQVGRLVAVTYLDAKGSKVDHTGLGVAEFSYSYNSSDELLQVEAYDKVGNKVDPTWNPDH
jgi:YD repeat-containing protein